MKKYSLYSIFPVLVLVSILFVQPGTASSTSHPCAPGETPDVANNYCDDSLYNPPPECEIGENPTDDQCVCRADDSLCLGNGGGGGNTGPGDGANTGPGDGGTTSVKLKLENPIGSDNIKEFIIKIIDVLLIFAVPIIILFIMYAGFLFTTARGDTTKITEARTALLWAVVGGVIILGAKLIIEVIEGTITAF